MFCCAVILSHHAFCVRNPDFCHRQFMHEMVINLSLELYVVCIQPTNI